LPAGEVPAGMELFLEFDGERTTCVICVSCARRMCYYYCYYYYK